MAETRRFRLAIVASHVIQYQDPLFRLIAAEPQIDLTVVYCSRHGAESYFDEDMKAVVRWNIQPLIGYRHVFLRNLSPFGPQARWMSVINPGVIRAIRRGRFDAVLLMLGWGTVTSWLAFWASAWSRTPLLVYGDSGFVPPDRGLRGRLRRRLLEYFFARVSGFLISGKLNGEYYRHYGADPLRFFSVPWATDNERFAAGSAITEQQRWELRRQYGIDADRVVVVFSGKLVTRKDPLLILDAVVRMRHRSRIAVLYIGDGELRPQIVEYARRHGIDQVGITGFVNQTELPRMYALGDIFVLPSRFEPRGMVVNEAMACGLPVIVSTSVGAAGDIARHGENGFIFETGDAEALAAALDRVASDDGLRQRMGRRSRQIIATWDYRADVQGILSALQFVTSK